MADLPDPTIRLSIPGGGTFDLCTVAEAGESCSITLVNGEPDTTIGADGFASFAVKNVDTHGLTVDAISFFFQTQNLFQPFSGFADDFQNVGLVRHFNEGCIFDVSVGCVNPVGTLEVDFSGMQKPGDPGVATPLPEIVCDFEGCPTQVGFDPGSSIFVTAHFDFVDDPNECCDGIQPGEEQLLTITPDVPEPSSLVLLLGAAGLLAIKRRFKFHCG